MVVLVSDQERNASQLVLQVAFAVDKSVRDGIRSVGAVGHAEDN